MCRSGDTVGRLGGDELAMVLPGTGEEAAAATAERIVSAFARHGVGVSVGVAAGPGPGTTAAELIESADRALLAAKSAGKRRVRLAS
jgi:diguanylate cyclase (GGDEF)-like protein